MERDIAVLMSTYNGERYLREQVDSILAQERVDVRILVRDDGSTDATGTILDEYRRRGALAWRAGENLGPARSFMRLLAGAPDCGYYAFSDQDDVWLPGKLAAAVDALAALGDVPAMYLCQARLVDAALAPIGPEPKLRPRLTFGEALVHEFCSGCTVVLNRGLRAIVAGFSPEYLPMHDGWVYCVAHAVGARVVFDPVPRILYRQHGGNAVGLGNGFLHGWRLRLRRLAGGEHERYRRALEIRKGFYGDMPPANREILDAFIGGRRGLRGRIGLLLDGRFCCSDAVTGLLFRLAVLLGTY